MHRNPDHPEQWIGADDVGHEEFISLDGVPQDTPAGKVPLMGILIDKLGPDPVAEDDGPEDVNLFGYWPAFPATWKNAEEDDWEIQDSYVSLPKLCEEHGLPLADVIDRIAIELLRFAQKAKA